MSARDVILPLLGKVEDAGMDPDTLCDRILAALEAAGLTLAPVEPTEAMIDAGGAAYFRKITDMASVTPTEHHADGGGPVGYAYRAMLAAAKEPAP